MKKLLYIIANSKSEEMSSCRNVSRRLINAILAKDSDIELEELDLYKDHIPQLKVCYFESRSTIVSTEARKNLSEQEQNEVAKIEQLSNQFKDADIYVLAAPMWSLSFPSVVKEYLDCIIQSGITIGFDDSKPYPMLDNKNRIFIYVQSSGANIPWILTAALNKGLNYVCDVMRFIGIATVDDLLVDGTGETEEECQNAIKNACEKIDPLVDKLF